MGRLTDIVRSTRVSRKPKELPEWWTLYSAIGGIVLLAVAMVLVFSGALGDDPVADPGGIVPGVVNTDDDPEPEDPTVPGDGTQDPTPEDPTTPAPGNEGVEVPTVGGTEKVIIPGEAYRVIQLAATAFYTGDYSNVPKVDEGYDVDYKSEVVPKVLEVSVLAQYEVNIDAQVRVDSDGSGDIRTLPISVVEDGSGWKFQN